MLKKIMKGLVAQKADERRAELYRNLIRHEARIGGTLFGPVRTGGRREFFCLDKNTWVWHEEWVDDSGRKQMRTTRYDVRPGGILKSQNGHYSPISSAEARHLKQAALLYRDKVRHELYASVA